MMLGRPTRLQASVLKEYCTFFPLKTISVTLQGKNLQNM